MLTSYLQETIAKQLQNHQTCLPSKARINHTSRMNPSSQISHRALCSNHKQFSPFLAKPRCYTLSMLENNQ